jgi:poly(3-hydroxybutyrate) depolymerase
MAGAPAGRVDADGGDGGAAGAAGDPHVPDWCASLQSGLNQGVIIDDIERSFILTLPQGVDNEGPWPVVFNWHGLGDTATNMSGLLSGQVNRADFPFIAVTPEDTNFEVTAMGYTVAMDWDIFDAGDGNANREVRLFDEVLSCLDARYGVDSARVHALGFSIGSIVVDLLGIVRGDQLASIATYSGGYFSNPDNVASLGLLQVVGISWPQPSHDNAYPQLLLHGGDKDTWSPGMGLQVKFYEFAENDAATLVQTGHDAIVCNHGMGHMAPPPGMPGSRLIDFFRDHPRGTTISPYRKRGLPANFASYCELRASGGDDS